MRFLASAGALLQLGVTAVALLIWIGVEHAFAWLRDNSAAAGTRFRNDRIAGGAALGAMLLSAAAVFGGLAVLALWSVAGLVAVPRRAAGRDHRADLDERRAAHRQAARDDAACGAALDGDRHFSHAALPDPRKRNRPHRRTRCARFDLFAADRAAGRLPVRPAAAVHSAAARRACPRWSSPIWSSCCLMCSCRFPIPGAPMTAAMRRSPLVSARTG